MLGCSFKMEIEKTERGHLERLDGSKISDWASGLILVSLPAIRTAAVELSLGEDVLEYNCTLVTSLSQDQVEMSTMQLRIRRNQKEYRFGSWKNINSK